MDKKFDLVRFAPNSARRCSGVHAVRGCTDTAVVDDGEAQCAILCFCEITYPGMACGFLRPPTGDSAG